MKKEVYIKKGKELLEIEKWGKWEEFVNKQIKSFYGDLPIKACLAIIEELNKKDFQKAKEALEKQNHSGASLLYVLGLVSEFHRDGAEFKDIIQPTSFRSLKLDVEKYEKSEEYARLERGL